MSPLESPNARNRIRRLLRRPGPIEVVVAEDDPLYAARLILALGRRDDVDVVGHAHNGAEAVQLVGRLKPNVVLMDLEMPVLDGIEATRRLREAGDGTAVVVLTSSDSPGDLRRAFAAGADDYMTKTVFQQALLGSIRAAAPAPAARPAGRRPAGVRLLEARSA